MKLAPAFNCGMNGPLFRVLNFNMFYELRMSQLWCVMIVFVGTSLNTHSKRKEQDRTFPSISNWLPSTFKKTQAKFHSGKNKSRFKYMFWPHTKTDLRKLAGGRNHSLPQPQGSESTFNPLSGDKLNFLMGGERF